MVKSYAQALRIQNNRVKAGKHGIAAAVRRAIRANRATSGPLPYIARTPVFKAIKDSNGEDVREFVRYAYSERTYFP